MYQNLGIHWASSIPAFLALMCVPFPFLFYKYGEKIRMKCKYAAEAAEALERMKLGRDPSFIEEDEEGRVIGEDGWVHEERMMSGGESGAVDEKKIKRSGEESDMDRKIGEETDVNGNDGRELDKEIEIGASKE